MRSGEPARYLAAGDIRARSSAITRATELVVELLTTLDYQNGGEISANLGRLYDYILTRLNEANSKQIDAPLAEAERLLQTLLEAWEEQARTPEASPIQEERYEYA